MVPASVLTTNISPEYDGKPGYDVGQNQKMLWYKMHVLAVFIPVALGIVVVMVYDSLKRWCSNQK